MAEERDESVVLLKEIARWTRIAAAPTIWEWVAPALTNADERKVYQASTGVTSREIAGTTGVSQRTVTNYWNRWKSADPPIVREGERKGRYERLYDLLELNIPIEINKSGD